MSKTGITIAIVLAILLLTGITLFGVGYINNSPGLYRYSVDVEGLESYQPSLITDIIVPIPERNGQPVFSDDELQYQTFGDWKSIIVVTKVGKMLAFQSIGRNLTNIHAVFYKKYPDGVIIRNITAESLSPALPLVLSQYTERISGSDPKRDFSTIVYIPDTIRSLHGQDDFITFNLELLADEGMQHSVSGKVYRVRVSERIPTGIFNSTSVVAQVL
jgi:hypothetical protein